MGGQSRINSNQKFKFCKYSRVEDLPYSKEKILDSASADGFMFSILTSRLSTISKVENSRICQNFLPIGEFFTKNIFKNHVQIHSVLDNHSNVCIVLVRVSWNHIPCLSTKLFDLRLGYKCANWWNPVTIKTYSTCMCHLETLIRSSWFIRLWLGLFTLFKFY